MKILWVTTSFLHPTNKGGQIRTLEMLRRLHTRHEIHYAAIENPAEPEGLARAPEYCTRAYPFRCRVADKRSPAFALELARGLFDPLPVSVRRFVPPGMGPALSSLMERERFDCGVCDFLTPAAYFPGIERAVLFQHNVETMIWRRHAEHAGSPATAWYMRRQAERMFRFEGDICRRAGQIAAVSEQDACAMRTLFGAERVTAIPTGVDIEFFTPPSPAPAVEVDLSFTGSMDWQPNVDGVLWFTSEVLPLIRRERPDCSLAIVGRKPSGAILDLARRDPRIRVTGTVPDIRPHLWNSAVSIVPLRIGGGTRLKIYESMAARVPVVSTAIGAEGLEIHPPSDIRIADTPTSFADACLGLLADAALRQRQADAAWRMVSASFSWEQAARCFESVLERAPALVRAAGAGGR